MSLVGRLRSERPTLPRVDRICVRAIPVMGTVDVPRTKEHGRVWYTPADQVIGLGRAVIGIGDDGSEVFQHNVLPSWGLNDRVNRRLTRRECGDIAASLATGSRIRSEPWSDFADKRTIAVLGPRVHADAVYKSPSEALIAIDAAYALTQTNASSRADVGQFRIIIDDRKPWGKRVPLLKIGEGRVADESDPWGPFDEVCSAAMGAFNAEESRQLEESPFSDPLISLDVAREAIRASVASYAQAVRA
jgi:hypothetical protein